MRLTELVTSVLEIVGMVVAVTGLAVFWALVAPDGWGWPVGLMVWGLGAIAVSWFLDRISTEGGESE